MSERQAFDHKSPMGMMFVSIFNAGYHKGHHDTVEGNYIDILDCDSTTYHSDVVSNVIGEMTNLMDAQAAAQAMRDVCVVLSSKGYRCELVLCPHKK